MPVIPDFTDPAFHQTHTNAQLAVSILEGKDRLMPANRGAVTDDQAPDLVAFIRTFGPAAPAALVQVASGADLGPEFAKLQQEWGDLERQVHEFRWAPEPAKVPAKPAAPTRAVASLAGFFGQNCAGCHTIGGGALTGPDLRHVTARRSRDWLVQYLQNPKGVIESGDPYALHLLAEARNVVMPRPFGMTRERAENILEFLEAESKLEKSQFAGPPVPDMPFPPGDADRGRELFVGRRRLANGGPACVNCHTADGLGDTEGGRLGPDLTTVFERLGGRTSLTARLWAPATPTMLPVYKDHALQLDEVMSLVAWLEATDKQGVERASGPPLKLLLLGLGGTVLVLAAVSLLWGGSLPRREHALVPPSAAATGPGNGFAAASQGPRPPAGAQPGPEGPALSKEQDLIGSGL